ncbi:50L [Yaba monkey tumor virus]|uniref:Metalloendopeptidase n=1 Tax=Yaba monkey tumor virus (strain VR587) TaxID=928314 RepID=Q6TUW3_YMTV5|nr:putative metalloprotease [Yaba monkey tumor virus]AAR07406.1 50L [Yaba monkey tumor virus]
MIVLSNGVRIFINDDMNKDIYLGVASFGFENDIGEILGVAHLLEHILISFDSSKFIANASTARKYMSFWCCSIKGKSSYIDSVNTLISWFFINNKLRDSFLLSNVKNHIKELENEYYFRNEVFHCMDVLTFLENGDLYNGGRIDMLNNLEDVNNMLCNRMKKIIGPNIVIFVKELNKTCLNMLQNSFGTLPSCPMLFSLPTFSNIEGKIIMMPSPFYTVMIKISLSISNVISIICLFKTYHLIDYETVGNDLYITLSFVKENDYENFINGVSTLKFDDVTDYSFFSLCDDFLMNIYLCFPWLSHDITDYLTTVKCTRKMFKSLEDDIRDSLRSKKYVVVYPHFSKTVFNKNDRQMHKIVILDCLNSLNNELPRLSVNLMKKQTKNKILIKYNDSSLIKYVNFAIGYKHKILKENEGVCIHHQFSSEDISSILESDTFLKYNKSKPGAMYQYLLLSFFVSGYSIEDILLNRESTVKLLRQYNNKILFGKKAGTTLTTKSNFVGGLLKSKDIRNNIMTSIMWELKKMGLIYSMEHTKIDKKIFYIFMFTIYPDDVFSYFSKKFLSHCLVVSKKGPIDDFSSIKKDVIIKLC